MKGASSRFEREKKKKKGKQKFPIEIQIFLNKEKKQEASPTSLSDIQSEFTFLACAGVVDTHERRVQEMHSMRTYLRSKKKYLCGNTFEQIGHEVRSLKLRLARKQC